MADLGEAPSRHAVSLTMQPEGVKLAFRGRPKAVDVAGGAFGIAFPRKACRFVASGARSVFWLGPDEWLLQAAGEAGAGLAATLETALHGQSYSLVDVSDRSLAFLIAGEASAYLLNHGCPLDLSIEAFPPGMSTRTIIGKAPVLLWRTAPDAFHVDVWRSFIPYVWQLLDEARAEPARRISVVGGGL